MIRLRDIIQITVTPDDLEKFSFSLQCLGGRAKWLPESDILSLTIDIIDSGNIFEKFLEFLGSNKNSFCIEAACRDASACFRCYKQNTFEIKSGTARPAGPSTTRFYFSGLAKLNGAPKE